MATPKLDNENNTLHKDKFINNLFVNITSCSRLLKKLSQLYSDYESITADKEVVKSEFKKVRASIKKVKKSLRIANQRLNYSMKELDRFNVKNLEYKVFVSEKNNTGE